MVQAADNVEETYQQDWTAQITGSATLKATQPFEIDGQNVTINGQSQVSIQGNTTLTISCGGAQIQLSSCGRADQRPDDHPGVNRAMPDILGSGLASHWASIIAARSRSSADARTSSRRSR